MCRVQGNEHTFNTLIKVASYCGDVEQVILPTLLLAVQNLSYNVKHTHLLSATYSVLRACGAGARHAAADGSRRLSAHARHLGLPPGGLWQGWCYALWRPATLVSQAKLRIAFCVV